MARVQRNPMMSPPIRRLTKSTVKTGERAPHAAAVAHAGAGADGAHAGAEMQRPRSLQIRFRI